MAVRAAAVEPTAGSALGSSAVGTAVSAAVEVERLRVVEHEAAAEPAETDGFEFVDIESSETVAQAAAAQVEEHIAHSVHAAALCQVEAEENSAHSVLATALPQLEAVQHIAHSVFASAKTRAEVAALYKPVPGNFALEEAFVAPAELAVRHELDEPKQQDLELEPGGHTLVLILLEEDNKNMANIGLPLSSSNRHEVDSKSALAVETEGYDVPANHSQELD